MASAAATPAAPPPIMTYLDLSTTVPEIRFIWEKFACPICRKARSPWSGTIGPTLAKWHRRRRLDQAPPPYFHYLNYKSRPKRRYRTRRRYTDRGQPRSCRSWNRPDYEDTLFDWPWLLVFKFNADNGSIVTQTNQRVQNYGHFLLAVKMLTK